MSESSVKAENTSEQAAAMFATPQNQHRWLQRLVGEWTYASDEGGGTTSTGTESVRAVGDLWIVGEGKGQMGGEPATMLLTLGYNPQTGRFVGTWVGSMMYHLWIYDGELDTTGRVLTLNSEGPSMAGDGTMSRYQDIIEIQNDDHRVLCAQVLQPDGKWHQFMTMEYHRRT